MRTTLFISNMETEEDVSTISLRLMPIGGIKYIRADLTNNELSFDSEKEIERTVFEAALAETSYRIIEIQ
ncbi:MAG: hypothetical protein L0K82_07895 [Pisciglobus halotolerans]|nr:hypothetical protein [Pisciglobus halotolerans]